MKLLSMGMILVLPSLISAHAADDPKPIEPVPSQAQMEWQRMGMAMFVHFGVNTFLDHEWGDGSEKEEVFFPDQLDCNQWAKTAKESGFGLVILTAKHHDGFCLWPSEYTKHSVAASPWKSGHGDVVKEFTEACDKIGIKHGLYLSPWDRHDPRYSSGEYNQYYINQLTELLTKYPTVSELWMDGAKGDNRPMDYDFQGIWSTAVKLQPSILVATSGPHIRWVGNEAGIAREDETSVKDAGSVDADIRKFWGKQTSWYPAECDASIRPGWFWHASEDNNVKSLEQLLHIYFASVGRNAVMLLNVPANIHGLLSPQDVTRLHEFKGALDQIFKPNFLTGAELKAEKVRGDDSKFAEKNALSEDYTSYWATDDDVTKAEVDIRMASPQTFNVFRVREPIQFGERVRAYHVDGLVNGQWILLCKGNAIGSENLKPFPTVTAQQIRFIIDDSRACPLINGLGLFFNPYAPKNSGSLLTAKAVVASVVHPSGTWFGGDKAIDDDPLTRWATPDGTKTATLEVDLGQVQKINRVFIDEFYQRIKAYRLEVRNGSDEPWKAAKIGGIVGSGYDRSFPEVTGRYVRLNILDAADSPTINEFQLFGPDSPALVLPTDLCITD